MKITFLAPHIKIAGGTRVFLNYADLLSKRNHEVTVIVPISNLFKKIAGNIFRKKVGWIKGFAATIKWVPNYEEKYIPDGDVVIATAWQTAGPVASYSPTKGKKFYLVQHYESLYHGAPGEVDTTYILPLHKIVFSHWLKDILKDKFGASADFIPMPLDFELFHYIKDIRPTSPIRVLLMDHNAKWKGTTVGARAVDLVRKKFPDTKLILFGVRRKITDILHDEYFYNPKQENLAKIYSSCHIFLCPSEDEGLGLPSMEAMACKCAVVTYDNGGSRDFAKDGETAFVARHGDFNELTSKLELAVSDAILRQKIAEAGYEFIKKSPSWQEATEKLENIFKNA